jgi:hypothetical protein
MGPRGIPEGRTALVTLSHTASKMSRAALLCCTALALLFSVGAAHAQQGNLPTPVQKLPAYPPVVCVTPNWMPEPCESRQVADEGGRWEWQCGNVNVKVTQKVTLLEKPFNLPTSTEYVVTGIEKSNNRFQYVWGKDDLYLNGRLCVLKAKPLPKKDETKPEPPTAEPVKCLKPDGTEEPCENRHTGAAHGRCQSINVAHGQCLTDEQQELSEQLARESKRLVDQIANRIAGIDRLAAQGRHFEVWTLPADLGGDLHAHIAYFRKLATLSDRVEILHPCYSACTMVVAYIEKDRICFGEQASLNFHQARSYADPSALVGVTKWMIAEYPRDISQWILRKGGHNSMPSGYKYWTLPASELWEMGYRKCSY